MVGFGALGEYALGEAPPLDERDLRPRKVLLSAVLDDVADQLTQLTEFGHNGPPVDKPLPLTVEEIDELRGAIATLKAHSIQAPHDQAAIASLGLLKTVGKKLGDYVDSLLGSMAKTAGEELVKWGVRCGAFKLMIDWAAQLAQTCLQLPGPPS